LCPILSDFVSKSYYNRIKKPPQRGVLDLTAFSVDLLIVRGRTSALPRHHSAGKANLGDLRHYKTK